VNHIERLHAGYTVAANGCWEWKYVNWAGYGGFRYDGRRMGAHRAAYELLVGPIPDGMDIDHLCRNRRCVNPAHLQPVTRSENLSRGEVGRWNTRKTHCPKGHPYSPANTYHDRRGWRGCRTCRQESSSNYQARKKAAS
jgi:hypothetical protein